MELIRNITLAPVRRPHHFHTDIHDTLSRYAESNISHTLLYGPAGCGKTTLAKQLIAMHMQVPLTTVFRTQLHIHADKDKEHYFTKSNVHFELDVHNFLPSYQSAMIGILLELSKTVNVAFNRYKIILIRNAEHISRSTQQQLRMMMESMYPTTRLIFVCSNVDCLDDTLLSRMVCVRVPAPSDAALLSFMREQTGSPSVSPTFKTVMRASNNNITQTIFKHLTKSIPDEVTFLANELWAVLRRSNPMVHIRDIVQKSSTMHTPWNSIINTLVTTKVLVKQTSPEMTASIIQAWNRFAYQYAQESHREYAIEEFLCELSMLMKHAHTPSQQLFMNWL